MKAYQLKVSIKNAHPPIWRRCIVPAGITFSQLGVLLNEIMGWNGSHLFSFEFRDLGMRIEEITDDDWTVFGPDAEEAAETLIDPFMEHSKWFTYIYDFGDDWEHRVDVESVLTDFDQMHPVVVKAKGACPFEDCGGLYGYYHILKVLENPSHEEYEEIAEWLEDTGYTTDEFDPAFYDMDEMNRKLEQFFPIRLVNKPDTSCAAALYEKLFMKDDGFLDVMEINENVQYRKTSEATERKEAKLEEWRALYEAAMAVKELKPWETFYDMDLITLDGGWEEEVYASILGRSGECYGITIYEGLDGLNDFMMLTLSDHMNIPSDFAMACQNNLTCYWGNREEMDEEQHRIVKELGYKFRGKNQWLYFLSFKKGYFPYNMDQNEVHRMTSYLALLKDAILYYRDHQIQVKFEAEETFVYSAKGKKVTGEAKPLPFTGHNFPVLTLTDEEVLEELRNSEKCSAVLEADIISLNAGVQDAVYDRPANPWICLLADAQSGMILEVEMTGPEDDEKIILAEELLSFISQHGVPKEIRVRNVLIEAILEQVCKESGIKLRRVKRLPNVEEFMENMKKI